MLNLENVDFQTDPFPYAVIRPAFDPDVYQLLLDNYPEYQQIVRGRCEANNILLQYHAAEVMADPAIPAIWRAFFAYHSSPEFLARLASILPIYQYYPHLESATIGRRYRDNSTIQMDCLFGVNTKVTTPRSVKGPHLDNARELFACLCYFPVPGDEAGGDLTIYKYTTPNPRFYGQRFTDDVEPITTIPYAPNTAVLFLNTFHSLHGVTIRQQTDLPRRYVNIETEVSRPLFEIPIQ